MLLLQGTMLLQKDSQILLQATIFLPQVLRGLAAQVFIVMGVAGHGRCFRNLRFPMVILKVTA